MPALPPGGDDGSSQGGSFTPSKSNLYNAVKAIFHPGSNDGVTADASADDSFNGTTITVT